MGRRCRTRLADVDLDDDGGVIRRRLSLVLDRDEMREQRPVLSTPHILAAFVARSNNAGDINR
jgi:hypothetical protein